MSRAIGAMTVLCLPVPDEPGPQSQRGAVERGAIALLSNRRRPPIDAPSQRWLGRDASRPTVRESGLWNANHVDEAPHGTVLDLIADLVRGAGR